MREIKHVKRRREREGVGGMKENRTLPSDTPRTDVVDGWKPHPKLYA